MNLINEIGKHKSINYIVPHHEQSLSMQVDTYARLSGYGVGEVKITFVNSEGSKKGMDLEFSKKIISNVDLPIIFEGGLRNVEQIIDMIKIGANSFAVGSMITFKDYNIYKIKQYLFNKGYKVRF